MPPPVPDNQEDTSSLERARERLYSPGASQTRSSTPLSVPGAHSVPHAWGADPIKEVLHPGPRRVRLAGLFLIGTVVFFLIALAAAAYFFYYGGNSVSVNNVTVSVQGPTSIAGGDMVPLSVAVTNQNSVTIDNATVEIEFPSGTRSASDILVDYPRYVENLGSIESGASVTRAVKAVIFGASGDALSLPVSVSYRTAGSNAVFVKKSTYDLTVASTPLSVSISSLSETVSGQPLTLTITVRSNATAALQNVVLSPAYPFGFSVTSSSVPASGSGFLLGSLAPGATKTVTVTGTLQGQDNEQRVFHFSVGTAKAPNDPGLAITYMNQSATVIITAPFIQTNLSIGSSASVNPVIPPGTPQSATLSYKNTLSTVVTNATVAVQISGSAVDYNSIQTTDGFYRSSDHTIVFSKDTDPALATLAPGASGIGSFTFSTVSSGSVVRDPTITFTVSVSGTRIGQANVPERISASAMQTAKVATAVAFSANALRTSGPFFNTGPIPPQPNQPSTYTVVWQAQNSGSAVAGGTVSATLPSYVEYTGKSTGSGTITYDSASRIITWDAGDLAQGSTAQAAFQLSFTPSTSQSGSSPYLTSAASFSGFDRFAGIQVSATANPVSTQTFSDPGYNPQNGTVK